MRQLRALALLVACGVMALAQADVLTLAPDHPQTYVVKKGDTLWDISELFLKSPWKWPRLWQANPQVENPHLIYPGDRLTLIFVDGEPRLTRKRLVKLSPTVRSEIKVEPIATIPLASIKHFLTKDHIIDPATMDGVPYVLGDNNAATRMTTARPIYARGDLTLGSFYGIYRIGQDFVDRDSDELLGQSLNLMGVSQAKTSHDSGVIELTLKRLQQEIRQGDILLPLPDQDYIDVYFTPHVNAVDGGYIMASGTNNNSAVVGRFDIVVINKGGDDQLTPGDMFSILKPGQLIVDTASTTLYKESASTYDHSFSEEQIVALPDESIGELMVFKVYDKLSFGIITRSSGLIRPGYSLGNL